MEILHGRTPFSGNYATEYILIATVNCHCNMKCAHFYPKYFESNVLLMVDISTS